VPDNYHIQNILYGVLGVSRSLLKTKWVFGIGNRNCTGVALLLRRAWHGMMDESTT